ncbi:alkylhydroperoxidase like protein, AhpD family [Methanohalobium evestigatum Z-7303]|uniref:Alkylhydroperoxidase like protein, AhpD family n=1 Tax=Methanohalobium evestigatum (strain ATCC BAA-1072 / DSM 3721 / NBRC 107634 / OCM 161 / Z-7303) TaxID=644295 RepID=D7E7U0_METEZ|nr:carboxymuconolactone decarboxylase family protein [Methanohalobium evestigatum]ADI74163.1 alkylhydroperoxidase like protein, AhpD family [Methanohalobium evestigatum Z-7303]
MNAIEETLNEQGLDLDNIKGNIMGDGAVSSRTKKLLTIASAVATGCDECVEKHKKEAKDAGINDDEISEAILVASLIRFGSGIKYLL